MKWLRAALEAMTVTNDASKLSIEELENMSIVNLNCLQFSKCELSVLDEVFKIANCLEQSSILR
jgi:hypothetical protein